MATPLTALVPSGGADPTIAGNVRTVLDSQRKLDEILMKLSEDFRGSVLNLAKDVIAPATPATFNVESFANNWTQQLDRFRSRSAAVISFQGELASVIDSYKRENAPELIKALEASRALLAEELRQRDEIDAAIKKQIIAIEQVIAELRAYQKVAKSSPVPPATARSTKTKAAGAKKAGKKRTGKKPARKQLPEGLVV